MVLSIVVILLVGIIAFFHFTEGFLTALISAISAVLAAALAVGYCEPVVANVFHATMADCSDSIALVLLFVVGYTVIRMLFDKLIPGNVRTPATLDKVASAAMGLVAGTYAVGIFVIALQMLPYGPTISFFGYARFPVVATRAVYVHGSGYASDLDAVVNDQMVDATLDPEKETQRLWLPVDDLVLNTVGHLSDGGSLAGARTLASVHPDWLGELFGERLGEQTGNRRNALVAPGTTPVTVEGVYAPASLPAYDGYGENPKRAKLDTELRPPGYKSPYGDTIKAGGGKLPLVVRIKLRPGVTDDADHFFRFSPGQVRLALRQPNGDGEFGPATNYNPIGTMEDGKVITSRVDDFLFLNMAQATGFDAVFMVDKSALVDRKDKAAEVAPGTFIVVKRLATIDLSGTPVGDAIPPDAGQKVLRSEALQFELHPTPG
jgi:hypothetical protein